MKLLSLFIGLFSLLGCSSGLVTATSDDATFEIPFSFEKGHVIVHARIKKDLPVEVVIATGAEHSTVDMALLEKYKLQSGYAGEPPVTGHNDRIYFFSIVPDVRLGDARATSLSMHLVSLSEVSKAVGREIFGVLGADFFKGRVVQFDFRKKLIRFLSQSATDELTDQKAGRAPNESTILRMIENDDPYKNVTVPVVEGVTIDGKKVKVLLDTGAVMVVGISSSTAKKLGFVVPPDKTQPRPDKIGSLRLGTSELTDVPAIISAKGTELERDLSQHGAVVGVAILQNFLITFDFRNKLVVLERV